MSEKVKNIIAKRIIDKLDTFDGSWVKTWQSIDTWSRPRNPITGTHYSGINRWLLSLEQKGSHFATFKQIKEIGGTVKKGSSAIPVVFYNVIDKLDNETEKVKSFGFLRFYQVFSIEQDTQGLDHLIEKKDLPTKKDNEKILDCEKIIEKNNPKIQESTEAFYSTKLDYIGIPNIGYFDNSESYYNVLFHELTHWTGHETRLKRFEDQNMRFASKAYSFEELVAELGSCMLSQTVGILDKIEDNSKAYLKSWTSKIKDKPTDLFNALQKASKAYDLIMG